MAAILVGGAVGLALRKALPSRVAGTVMQGVGLAVVAVGLFGAIGASFAADGGRLSYDHVLIMIASLAVGALVGEAVRVEDRLDSLGKAVERRFAAAGGEGSVSQGFVTATLVFCVGSMAIVGSLEDGIKADPTILLAKSALDGITSMIFASAMGAGVLLSGAAVGLYQGLITLSSAFVSPLLDGATVDRMSLVGSVLIVAIGLNMLKVAKVKVGNLLPAVFVPIAYGGALAAADAIKAMWGGP